MKRKFFVIRMKSMITWGKYSGKLFSWIVENDPDYIIWLSNNVQISLRYSHDIINWYLENLKVDLIALRQSKNLPCKTVPIAN